MKICDVLDRRHVIPGVETRDKNALLQELANRAAVALKLAPEDIVAALRMREQLGSTGIGHGVAIPHARLVDLERPFAMFARIEPPIDFDAIDGRPVDLGFLLLTPATGTGDHLSLLAAISRLLRNEAVVAALRRSPSAREIYDVLAAASA